VVILGEVDHAFVLKFRSLELLENCRQRRLSFPPV